MKRFQLTAAALLLVLASSTAHGQFSFGGDSGTEQTTAPPWTSFHLNPKSRLLLDFRNASVDSVIHVLSGASGIAIIKDPALNTTITLQSPKPQSLNDAFSMFQAVLNLKNYDLTKQDNFLVIKAKATGFGGRGGFGTTGGNGGGFGGFGGGRSQSVLRVYALKYANATDLAKVINDVYAQSTSGQGGGFGGFGGFSGFGGGNNAAGGGNTGGGTGRSTNTVKASADDYSNSLIVNATSTQQDQISDIIDEVDRPADQPLKTQVYPLKYALASDLETEVQTVLTGSTTVGRGSQASSSRTTQNQGGGFGGGFFARFGNNNNSSTNNANGTVTADVRTNSLIVTARQANLDTIGKVIDQLDQPANYQGTTWVYTLKNARADVVANLLNASFGNRTTNGPTGGSLTNNGVTQTPSSTGATSSAPSSLSTGTTARSSQNGLQLATNTTQSQNTATTGIDDLGHVVNIRNLTGQVLLVPNVDTNSIIIVSPPEDRKIVEEVLAQMDQTPEQVMIETLVVEATLDDTDQLGVNWNFASKNPLGGVHGTLSGSTTLGDSSTTSTPQGLNLTLSAANYSAVLTAIKSDNKFNVLSTPRIYTTNNATAKINISESLPYETSQTVDTSNTGSNTYTYSFLDVGIVLTVTPLIKSNGDVTMDVSQTANDFVSYTSFNAPIVDQRETDTTVTVSDGKTVVLGGLIQNSTSDVANKVPILGDLPIVGSLFKTSKVENKKTELLVFLTPHIVHSPEEAERIKTETEAQLGRTAQQMVTRTKAPEAPKSVTPLDPTAK